MAFPKIFDQWSYEDPECEKVLQKYWWNRTSPAISFVIAGKEGSTQEVIVGEISQAILDSTPGIIAVRGSSRVVEYFALHVDKTWYLGAFIDRDESNELSSVCVSVTPTNSEIFDHVMNWVVIQLF